MVRRGGEFNIVSSEILPRREALILGAEIVDQSAAQTFKLERSDEDLVIGSKRKLRFDFTNALSKIKFKGNDVFGEKQKNLIDTAGELREITFKGIQASAAARSQLGRFGL